MVSRILIDLETSWNSKSELCYYVLLCDTLDIMILICFRCFSRSTIFSVSIQLYSDFELNAKQ